MIPVVILSAAAAVLFIAAVLLLLRLRRLRGLTEKLADDAEEYIKTGRRTPFSVDSGSFSRLSNAICGLEDTIETERAKHANDNRRNADFVADVSHQLKTPLAGIKLYCEMLDAEYPCEHTEKELILIEKTEKLIAELLKLQKLQADTFDFDFENTELARLFAGLQSDMLSVFPGKRIGITGNAVLRCDRMWFSEAAGNIIKNSCEHTGADGTIGINILDSDASVSVLFEDNGGGVPEEQLPMLFERFYKASGSVPQSTGLGLAITRAIIEKHHGTISAENGAAGLRITVCIPKTDGIESIKDYQ